MPPQIPLTKRQRQILDFYASYIEQHSLSPTLEEVAQAFGLNKVTVFGHVAELERKGVFERQQAGISRGIRIAPEFGSEPDAPRPRVSDGPAIEIRGKIAAGAPIEAIEDVDLLDWNALAPKQSGVYALRVQGDSMIEDGIHSGDLVLIEPRSSASEGETVVAILENEEATLKKLYRTGTGFRLQPANAALDPIFTDKLDVRGVLVGVVRSLR